MIVRSPSVSLQISLAPADVGHARHILPHQLRQWAGQVQEILCTLDLRRSGGRFGEDWHVRSPQLVELVKSVCSEHPNARWVEVDYSRRARRVVSRAFFAGRRVPLKDYRGGPYYSYFFGLNAVRHDYVFHLDSDMLFGGGSQSWVSEALHVLQERPAVFVCSPLPGPPTPDGQARQQKARIEPFHSLAHGFDHFTSRLFLIDRRQLSALGPLVPMRKFGRRKAPQAWLRRTSTYDLPELLISATMKARRVQRFCFLGAPPGVWAVHPDERSVRFYAHLPEIIQRIERGDIPQTQRGFYDLQESMLA